jgi:fermentation-respiration switch protein FrsA (DUF1100 family)
MDVERKDIEFDCRGDHCAAWLYPISAAPVCAPLVVMAHGLSGTRRDGLGPFAERFAAAGIAALIFDHRGFGDSGGEPDLFHPARQLEDWRAAIAYARSLDGIDPGRVATFGSSMGGGNALAAAAGDSKIAWLVCVGEADKVARPGPAIAAAKRAPLGELRIYPGVDHFDIYDGPEFEAVVGDEVAFLSRHLLQREQAS